jgi:hypothetical protein
MNVSAQGGRDYQIIDTKATGPAVNFRANRWRWRIRSRDEGRIRFCPNWPIREIQVFAISLGFWRARQDSNLRPLAPEANALSS